MGEDRRESRSPVRDPQAPRVQAWHPDPGYDYPTIAMAITHCSVTVYVVDSPLAETLLIAKLWCSCNSDVGVGTPWTIRVPTDLQLASDDSLWPMKHAHQGGGAAVESVEGGLEDVGRLVPRIGDRSARIERRIQVARNHNRRAHPREHRSELARLIGIHHDHEIRAGDGGARKRTRPKPGQIETATSAQCKRNLRHCAIAPKEPGRPDDKVGERPLQHRL